MKLKHKIMFFKQCDGFAVLMVMFVVMVFAALGMAAVGELSGSSQMFIDEYTSQQAFHVADAGLSYETLALAGDTDWSDNSGHTNAFGPGSFTISYSSQTSSSATVRSDGTVGGITRSVSQSFTKEGGDLVALDAAIYTEHNVEASGQGVVTANGNVYAGDSAIASGQGHLDINGDLSTLNGVSTSGQGQIDVSGDTVSNYSSISVPTPDWDYWQSHATTVVSGNMNFDSGTYNGNYYITGNVSISSQADVVINGTLVLRGSMTMSGQSQIDIHPTSGQPAIIAEGNVFLSGQNDTMIDMDGWIFTLGTATLSGQSDFDILGGIVGEDGVNLSGQGAVNVTHQSGSLASGFLGGETGSEDVAYGTWQEVF